MESLNIQNYISRLTSCGISTAEAVRTVCSFLKEFTESGYSTGRGYSRYIRDDYSMDTEEIASDLRNLMNEAPNDRMRQELQRIVSRVEQMDD